MSVESPDGARTPDRTDQPSAEEQARILADRYTRRALAYDAKRARHLQTV